MKPESISERLMFNTVRLETSSGMGTGFFYKFAVGNVIYPAIITNKHVVNTVVDHFTTLPLPAMGLFCSVSVHGPDPGKKCTISHDKEQF